MKKYLIALAAIAVVFGCSKEDPIQENTIQDNPVQEEPVNEEPEGTVVSFTATFPELTKATVDDTAFAWEVGDQIALPANNIEGGYAIFTNSAAYPSTFTYTLKPGESLKAGKALYPATTPGTEFASISAAKKAFQMEADYALGQSSLTFTHKSALINLNFSNVPSFATAIVVNDGASDVATINLSGISDGASVLADVPITPDGEKTYTFKLMENNNVLISKSKTATLAAGNYYHTPEIAVGRIIRVKDSVDWGSKELFIWNVDNTTECATFTTGYDYPYKFNAIDDDDHYIVLPSVLSWIGEGTAIGVKFQNAGASLSTQTDCIYLYRNFYFTVPSTSPYGMETEYRIYWDNGTSKYGNVKCYLWRNQNLYVKDNKGWTIYAHYYSDSDNTKTTTWNTQGLSSTKEISGTTYKYVPIQDFAKGLSDVDVIVYNFYNDSERGSLTKLDFNTNIYFLQYDGTSLSELTHLEKFPNGAWPGSNAQSAGGDLYYYEFSTADYGKMIDGIIFNDGGSNQSSDHVLSYINREMKFSN